VSRWQFLNFKSVFLIITN